MLLFTISLIVVALLQSTYSKECPTRASIEQLLLEAHIPGAVMVVVNSTDILYEEGFGHHSLWPVKMMDVDRSIFVLASISKTFIAVAVMQLVEANRLDLDADINQYLDSPNQRISHPQYPQHSITLRRLLSHSASIAINDVTDLTFMGTGDEALTRMSLADACLSYLNHNASNWLPKPPGTVTLYSNVGTSLAGLVVERVTKMPYEKYVREKILKPLGINLNEAGYYLSNIENREQLVKHYSFNSSILTDWNNLLPQLNVTQSPLPDWLSIPFFSVSIYPAGLLRMSARSLSIFLRMFMSNGVPLLSPRSIAQMRTVVEGTVPYPDPNAAIPDFGLIWNWRKLPNGRRYIGHGGSMPGARHTMNANEQNTVGMILLTNADVYPPTDTSREIGKTIETISTAIFDCFET